MDINTLLPARPREMPWNITLLLSVLSVQAFVCILMIVIVALIHPVVNTVHSTLDDVTILLPEMNATLTDVKDLIPNVEHMIYLINKICISVNCRSL